MNTVSDRQVVKLGPGKVKASARINLNGQTHEVSFIIQGDSVYEGIEPFLTLALLPAMASNQPIELDEPASPRLLKGFNIVQDVFTNWDKQFHRIAVKVPAKTLPAPKKPGITGKLPAGIYPNLKTSARFLRQNLNKKTLKRAWQDRASLLKGQSGSGPQDTRKVACFFSGGVDSFYTLLKNSAEIDTLIFVSGGFDVYPHPDNGELRRMITERLRQVAREMGKEFIEVEADLQNFSDNYVNWFYYYGSAMGALAQLLSNRFKKIYIASSYPYNNLKPCGSNPISDPLWRTEALEIIHDGCESYRAKKVVTIAKSPIAVSNLRVCQNYGENREYNCGKCEKCLRTMAVLQAQGILENSAFPSTINLEAISTVDLPEHLTRSWKDILGLLNETGKEPELARVIRERITKLPGTGIEEKIAALEEELARQERLYTKQKAWARSLEAHNVWLTEQYETATRWGQSLENEILARQKKRA